MMGRRDIRDDSDWSSKGHGRFHVIKIGCGMNLMKKDQINGNNRSELIKRANIGRTNLRKFMT